MPKARYGKEHQKLRAAVKRSVDAGNVRCWRCGQLIVPDHTRQGDGWHLGHDDELGGDNDYRGPEHDHCSWESGGMKRIGVLPTHNQHEPNSRDW